MGALELPLIEPARFASTQKRNDENRIGISRDATTICFNTWPTALKKSEVREVAPTADY